MTKAEIIHGLLNPGIVAVIRADSSGQLVECCEALAAGGVTAMEITMTTPNALETIKEVSTKLKGKVLLGVGTVLDAVTARLAILAGAEFVVTPITKADIVAMCLTYNKPIISGAFTPTEALAAHELGADFVKIFPADGLGATYIKNILAPLPQLQIIPTGGVDVNTAGAFIKAGSVALGAGSSLVSKDILKNRDWAKLTENAKALVKAVQDARAK
jgi:2-dehydro-3-deoxyphosphogluconate aldolase/(4S)-4-hydroxy-2-oxoglutarate aldolase